MLVGKIDQGAEITINWCFFLSIICCTIFVSSKVYTQDTYQFLPNMLSAQFNAP